MKRPSRNVVAIGIICLALVGSVLVYESRPLMNGSGDEVTFAMVDPGIRLEVSAREDTTDTDMDGLLDWQEILWGSDLTNKDTDGDGTEDGEEVRAGRNPTIVGPSDKVADLESLRTTTVYDRVQNNSATDKLSKNLFSIFLEAKKGGTGSIDKEDAQKIAASAANDVDMRDLTLNIYTVDAIAVSADSDLVQAKIYGEKLGTLYIESLYEIQGSGGRLAKIGETYRILARNLSLLVVPSSLRTTHVALLNNFHQSSIAFSIIADSENDPVKAALALQTYKKLSETQPTLFTTIATYIRRNAIIFDDPNVNSLWEKI